MIKFRIVNILSHPPAYDLYVSQPKPKINFNTLNGSWVGIWGYDWPDQLGNEILKRTDEFDYEVWQPDTRANKIYSHTFENGLIHRLFPAEIKNFPFSFGRKKEIISQQIVNSIIERAKEENLLIQINNYRGLITYDVLKKLTGTKIPIIITGHGSFLTPLDELKKMARHPYSIFSLLYESSFLFRNTNRINIAADENNILIRYISEKIRKDTFYLTMGIDYDYWNRRENVIDKQISLIKEKQKKIFLTVAFIIPRKRILELIGTFNKLKRYNNYCLIIVGTGEKKYYKQVREKAGDLEKEGKIIFKDYMRGEDLKRMYSASDYFITVSKSEGTQVAAMNASAMGIPIISTKNNGIADIMLETKSGLILDENVNLWPNYLEKVLQGEKITPIPQKIVFEKYDWKNVADKYIETYKNLFSKTEIQ